MVAVVGAQDGEHTSSAVRLQRSPCEMVVGRQRKESLWAFIHVGRPDPTSPVWPGASGSAFTLCTRCHGRH